MSRLDDARRAALNAEEAALLPAMKRNSMAGNAALREAMDMARAIGEKKISNLKKTQEEKTPAIHQAAHTSSRAALHHVLRK